MKQAGRRDADGGDGGEEGGGGSGVPREGGAIKVLAVREGGNEGKGGGRGGGGRHGRQKKKKVRVRGETLMECDYQNKG